jgi:integrase
MKLNEDTVQALPAPEKGNKVYYFPDAVLQGKKAPRGFGVRVTSGGARSFVINYRVKHTERRYTIGQYPDWSVLKAVKEAKDLRERIDRGDDPLAERRKPPEGSPENTLKAICEEFFKREGKALASKSWQERQLERLVYPTLGAMQIETIKRTDIVRLLDKIEDTNGPVMADRALAIIRKVMNWHATRSDEFRSPIVRGMARVKAAERARKRTLTDDEIRVVWRVAKALDTPFTRLIRFLLLTGARKNEAARMPHTELDDADWTLPAARNLKTKLELIRPLSGMAFACMPKGTGQYAFSTDGGRTPISGFSKAKKDFDQAVLEDLRRDDPAAKPLPNWTLHDLRRTARSLMSRAGVPSDFAERCLGHVIGGVRGVYDRYEYLDEKRHAYESLASMITGIINPRAAANVTPMRERQSA